MAFYVFTCRDHGVQEEIRCHWSELQEKTPTCGSCGSKMGRDYRAESFAGISEQSKGRYGFVSENLHPDGHPILVRDAQDQNRYMKQFGLIRGELSAEKQYRYKHRLDRTLRGGK